MDVNYDKKLQALAYISAAEGVHDVRLIDASLEKIYHELLKRSENEDSL